MGWILYKLNRNDEALPYLERAYEMYPDAEVAGHLIQVYFAQGQVAEAMKLLKKSQAEHPDNLYILEAAEAIGQTAAN
ncbi:tetratricopeptide repeat protein [Aliamphritea spongicola]|nr:tetratricopeptide repeat protein [Aliamphritea spongicola]